MDCLHVSVKSAIDVNSSPRRAGPVPAFGHDCMAGARRHPDGRYRRAPGAAIGTRCASCHAALHDRCNVQSQGRRDRDDAQRHALASPSRSPPLHGAVADQRLDGQGQRGRFSVHRRAAFAAAIGPLVDVPVLIPGIASRLGPLNSAYPNDRNSDCLIRGGSRSGPASGARISLLSGEKRDHSCFQQRPGERE